MLWLEVLVKPCFDAFLGALVGALVERFVGALFSYIVVFLVGGFVSIGLVRHSIGTLFCRPFYRCLGAKFHARKFVSVLYQTWSVATLVTL